MCRILSLLVFLVLTSCKDQEKKETLSPEVGIEIQGHRGARGLLPENSIQGFIKALRDGAQVIELDVVISKDSQVVVSHEAYMSSVYVLTPEGKSISREQERGFNLYDMTYDSIRKFETGLKGNPSFPAQHRISTYKPLLSEVIDSVENYCQARGLAPVKYNIELKSRESDYNTYQPVPEVFARLVMQDIRKKNIEGRFNIQSFDPNILEAMRKSYSGVPLAFLVSDPGIAQNLKKLSFVPEIYSPHYQLVVNRHYVDSVKKLSMRLIPWTVNDSASVQKLDSLQVDGIISDYPGRIKALLND